jgi:hypothetical protein
MLQATTSQYELVSGTQNHYNSNFVALLYWPEEWLLLMELGKCIIFQKRAAMTCV